MIKRKTSRKKNVEKGGLELVLVLGHVKWAAYRGLAFDGETSGWQCLWWTTHWFVVGG